MDIELMSMAQMAEPCQDDSRRMELGDPLRIEPPKFAKKTRLWRPMWRGLDLTCRAGSAIEYFPLPT
jgi:hypothetical protein